MSHVFKHQKQIGNRINRIKGQLDSVGKILDKEEDCFAVLQTLSACRGALNGLIGEVIDGHIRHHIMSNPDRAKTPQDKASEDLIKLLKTYWK